MERHAPDMDPHRHKPHEHQWPWERDDPPRELWEFAHTIKLDGFLPNNDTPSEWKREALAEAMQALGDALDEHIAAVQAVARTPACLSRRWPSKLDGRSTPFARVSRRHAAWSNLSPRSGRDARGPGRVTVHRPQIVGDLTCCGVAHWFRGLEAA